jgi:hypothetical protein
VGGTSKACCVEACSERGVAIRCDTYEAESIRLLALKSSPLWWAGLVRFSPSIVRQCPDLLQKHEPWRLNMECLQMQHIGLATSAALSAHVEALVLRSPTSSLPLRPLIIPRNWKIRESAQIEQILICSI